MQGLFKQALRRAGLHQLPQIHDTDIVGDMLHHAQIVGDEEIGQLLFLLKIHQQIQNLGLNGYVQSGNRFVTEDEIRVQGDGPGDADALSSATVELVGIGVAQPILDAHPVHKLLDPVVDLLPGEAFRLLQGLPDHLIHGVAGIQGGIGILENDLHPFPNLPKLPSLQIGDILPVQQDLSVGGVVEPDHGSAQGGLAAAGFAHHAHGLALLDPHGDIVHRVVDACGHVEVFLQISDFQHSRHTQPSFFARRH